MVVPQIGQVPLVAGLPFFMVIGLGSFISTFFLSLRQYPSTAMTSLSCTQHFRQRSRTRRIVSTHLSQFNPNTADRSPGAPREGARGGARLGRNSSITLPR